jgi:hypothetical protein
MDGEREGTKNASVLAHWEQHEAVRVEDAEPFTAER